MDREGARAYSAVTVEVALLTKTHPGALLSSDNFWSSVDRDGGRHPLWQAHMRAVLQVLDSMLGVCQEWLGVSRLEGEAPCSSATVCGCMGIRLSADAKVNPIMPCTEGLGSGRGNRCGRGHNSAYLCSRAAAIASVGDPATSRSLRAPRGQVGGAGAAVGVVAGRGFRQLFCAARSGR
jgi:hypothetical protein